MATQTQLSKATTIALLISAIAILGVFVFPLWKISLHAPQYPQGLGLEIWVDRVEGATPHDLQNINGLNHYIGMKTIQPEAIPELRYMKFFAAGLSLLGVAAALSGQRWALLVWTATAVVLAGVGMVDFYNWEYDYGHDLNPDAAIKIPGMSYQPPIIGTRQLLNFTTTAYPGMGGWLAMLAVAAGVVMSLRALGVRLWPRRECTDCTPKHVRTRRVAAVSLLIAMLGAIPVGGCSRQLQPIAYGTDPCEFCAMTISDDRYAAAFVTSKGRTYKFDSVECMLQSLMDGEKLAGTEVEAWYATSYSTRGVLVAASTAVYLVSQNVPSPMGAGITAFADRNDAEQMQQAKGGDVMDWSQVEQYIRQWSKS